MDRMQFLKQIQKRQEPLKGKLQYLNNGQSPYYNPHQTKIGPDELLGEDQGLSPGCQSCKDGTWWCLYVGHRCNLDCAYCPQGNAADKRAAIDHPQAMQRLWIRDIKFALQSVKPGTIQGISYSGGEPLLFMDKIIDMASFITDELSSYPIYQWCYTNGILATDDKLQMLADAGLYEIRFHLGATKFDPEIIKRAASAVKMFGRVTVETPCDPAMKEWMVDNDGLQKLYDIGVTQLNCPEQYFNNPRVAEHYGPVETYEYTSMARGRHTSPTFSRHITYDIIDHVVANDIDIIINDCNQESRDAQIQMRELNRDRLTEMY